MAKRNKRRGRPRGAPAGAATQAEGAPPAAAPTAVRGGSQRAAKRTRPARGAAARLAEQSALGERPQAPWHPLPLSEILIFVGLIAVVIGVARGESGLPVVAVGIAAVVIGTLDFSIREHLSGYRPHTSMLAALPTALLHGAVAIALLALKAPEPVPVVAPIVIDVPVFATLFKLLRARYSDARHERVLRLRGR